MWIGNIFTVFILGDDGVYFDFIDIEIDDEGRPWIALAHNVLGEIGIVGTMVTGPTLIGNITQLPMLEYGGPETI